MNYTTVCKPGDIFYGRVSLEYEEIHEIKVLSILITEEEGVVYTCSSKISDRSKYSTTIHFTEDDFKNLMFKTREAAQKDLEARTKLYESMNDYTEEIRFEDNLNIARKLIEHNVVNIDNLQDYGIFSETEYSYVRDLFNEQYQYLVLQDE